MYRVEKGGRRYVLESPTDMPNASGFLWNKNMLIQASCRGYANAQFMQPEASKYVSGPALEAKTFMQPEQGYYAHHPGRFFYIKDVQTGAVFSAPYEPIRANYQHFEFIIEPHQLSWVLECQNLSITLVLSLPSEDALELWQIHIKNLSDEAREIHLYPYFPVGYRSWMNQSASYEQSLQSVLCRSIEPYQKVEDYFKNKGLHEYTFLASDSEPDAWETRQQVFEGEGGLHAPSAIESGQLANGQANYCTPAAVLQFNLNLAGKGHRSLKFLFGPAKNHQDISTARQKYFTEEDNGFSNESKAYVDYLAHGKGCIEIHTPDSELDDFVNTWLPRQLYYHGDSHRLSTDPQTRNYLQDSMGMSYIQSVKTRAAFVLALHSKSLMVRCPTGFY